MLCLKKKDIAPIQCNSKRRQFFGGGSSQAGVKSLSLPCAFEDYEAMSFDLRTSDYSTGKTLFLVCNIFDAIFSKISHVVNIFVTPLSHIFARFSTRGKRLNEKLLPLSEST